MVRSLPRFAVALLTLAAVAACSSTSTGTGAGGDAGSTGSGNGTSPTEHNAPLGAKCHCVDFGDCCAVGLFCSTPDACNVKTSNGCYTEGTCSEKLKLGESCEDPRQCADRGAICASNSGCFVSPSTTLRCADTSECPDGRTCLETYCKVMRGLFCIDATVCASGYCTAGKCT